MNKHMRMSESSFFSIQNCYFIDLDNTFEFNKNTGWTVVANSLFADCHSSSLPPVFYFQYDTGASTIENVYITKCYSFLICQTFEIISRTNGSASISRTSTSFCGIQNTPEYTHGAVSRCATNLENFNSSFCKSAHESSFYLILYKNEHSVRFTHVSNCISEYNIIFSTKSKISYLKYINVNNCTSNKNNKDSTIIYVVGDSEIEYSNFVNNFANYLIISDGKTTLRKCYTLDMPIFYGEVYNEGWVILENQIFVLYPYVIFKRSNHIRIQGYILIALMPSISLNYFW